MCTCELCPSGSHVVFYFSPLQLQLSALMSGQALEALAKAGVSASRATVSVQRVLCSLMIWEKCLPLFASGV